MEERAFLTLSSHPSQSILTLSSTVCSCFLFFVFSWPCPPLPPSSPNRYSKVPPMATRKNSLTLGRHTPAPVRSSQELRSAERPSWPFIRSAAASQPQSLVGSDGVTESDRALEKDYGNGQPLSFLLLQQVLC